MRTINIVRGSENDIIIPDGAVKRNHASLIIDGNEFIIRDLDSVNDTFINGKRVYGQARLNRHDILKVGGALVPWMNYIGEFNKSGQATTAIKEDIIDQPVEQTPRSFQQNNLLPGSSESLVLGILSIVFAGVIGLILGIVALSKANRGLDLFHLNTENYNPRSVSQAKSGKICSIIGMILSYLVIVLLLIIYSK